MHYFCVLLCIYMSVRVVNLLDPTVSQPSPQAAILCQRGVHPAGAPPPPQLPCKLRQRAPSGAGTHAASGGRAVGRGGRRAAGADDSGQQTLKQWPIEGDAKHMHFYWRLSVVSRAEEKSQRRGGREEKPGRRISVRSLGVRPLDCQNRLSAAPEGLATQMWHTHQGGGGGGEGERLRGNARGE